MSKKQTAITMIILIVLSFCYISDSRATSQEPTEDQKFKQRMLEIAEESRKYQEIKQYRKTGKSALSKQELDALLDEILNGILDQSADGAQMRVQAAARRKTRFLSLPNCVPRNKHDECGVKDSWNIILSIHVLDNDVEATIQALIAQYGGNLGVTGPEQGSALARSPLGDIFNLKAPEAVARAMSDDPRVMSVHQESSGIIQQNGMIGKAAAGKGAHVTAQGVSYNRDFLTA